jgi:hypothetical protein
MPRRGQQAQALGEEDGPPINAQDEQDGPPINAQNEQDGPPNKPTCEAVEREYQITLDRKTIRLMTNSRESQSEKTGGE